MPRESFLNLRKYERMIAKITLPTPIHVLDHIIIPINVRESHWFPAHINLQTRSISLLDSSQTYSAAAYPEQQKLIWKFFKMVWTTSGWGKASAPTGGRGGLIRNREDYDGGGEEPPPTRRREVPAPSGGARSLPLPREVLDPHPYRGGGSACGLHCVSSPPEGGDD